MMRAGCWVLLMSGLGAAQEPLSPAASDLGWIERRVDEWQMKPSERKFDQIGWLTDIRQALELGRKHNRPVFLFTHDGRMAIGRC